MELAFETKRLREQCENETAGIEKLGDQVARSLRARLSDMRVAGSICDLPLGVASVHPTNPAQRLIELSNNWVLTIEANHVSNPIDEDGEINWKKVRRVKLISIDVGFGQ